MKFYAILLFMLFHICGHAMESCKNDFKYGNPNSLLISHIINQANESLPDGGYISIELNVRCRLPLPSLPNSDIYRVYPIQPIFSLYVPESVHCEFLNFLKLSKSEIDAEIRFIRLYVLSNDKFDSLFLLYAEKFRSYFMFGVRKESISENEVVEENSRIKKAAIPENEGPPGKTSA
jgi:hypothetical protein